MKNKIISLVMLLMVSTTSGLTATNIFYAIKKGDIKKVKEIINNDKNQIKKNQIKAKDKYGRTPLHYALIKGYEDIAKLLIEKGADVNAKKKNGLVPLYIALDKGYKDIAKLLIEKGANVNEEKEEGNTLLHLAVNKGYKDIVELLIEKGADVDAGEFLDGTPLDSAVNKGCKDIVELLIKEGADVNVGDDVGNTSLHSAAKKGNKDIVELLIKEGADVNAEDDVGNTSLHMAADDGYKDIVELLIKKDADVNKKNYAGDTPFDFARRGFSRVLQRRPHVEIVELIKKAKKSKTQLKGYLDELEDKHEKNTNLIESIKEILLNEIIPMSVEIKAVNKLVELERKRKVRAGFIKDLALECPTVKAIPFIFKVTTHFSEIKQVLEKAKNNNNKELGRKLLDTNDIKNLLLSRNLPPEIAGKIIYDIGGDFKFN